MIYLASQSPRRRDVLNGMGLKHRVVKSNYRERLAQNIRPEVLCLRHAIGKARKAQVPKHARIVLGADTIVWCRGCILGKPRSKKEARAMLRLLVGRTHVVFTGVAILNLNRNELFTGYRKTKVLMKRMSEEAIDTYFDEVDPLDKAGAYGIQTGPRIVARIDGSFTNVMGLPRELVKQLLKKLDKEP